MAALAFTFPSTTSYVNALILCRGHAGVRSLFHQPANLFYQFSRAHIEVFSVFSFLDAIVPPKRMKDSLIRKERILSRIDELCDGDARFNFSGLEVSDNYFLLFVVLRHSSHPFF